MLLSELTDVNTELDAQTTELTDANAELDRVTSELTDVNTELDGISEDVEDIEDEVKIIRMQMATVIELLTLNNNLLRFQCRNSTPPTQTRIDELATIV